MSRRAQIAAMRPGDRMLIEAPPGRLSQTMQQISTDIGRCGLRGLVTQSHVLAVEVKTHGAFDIVLIRRLGPAT